MTDKYSAEGLKAASDLVKQVITLSTGIIALTITFLESIIQPVADGARTVPWSLIVAWVLFVCTVILGMATLGTITGSLNALDLKQNGQQLTPDQRAAAEALADSQNVRHPARLMMGMFALALAFTVATAFTLGEPPPEQAGRVAATAET